MKLTQSEIATLKELRLQCIEMIVVRDAHDPAVFESNVHALQMLQGVMKGYLEIFIKHVGPAMEEIDLDHGFNFIAKIKAKYLNYEIEGLSEEMNSYLFADDTVREIMKREFAKEPRITGINSNFKNNETTRTRNGFFVEHVKEKIVENTIKFSDGDVLLIKSFDDKKELAEAKQFFDAKMESLSNRKKLVA